MILGPEWKGKYHHDHEEFATYSGAPNDQQLEGHTGHLAQALGPSAEKMRSAALHHIAVTR